MPYAMLDLAAWRILELGIRDILNLNLNLNLTWPGLV
jgi:hypothetical protein